MDDRINSFELNLNEVFVKKHHKEKKRPRHHPISHKRKRSADSPNHSTNKKQRQNISLEKMLQKISLNENNNHKAVKIFSSMMTSKLSNNLFENYFPVDIPKFYTNHIREQTLTSQIKKIAMNFSACRRLKLDEKRKILSKLEQTELTSNLLLHNVLETQNDKRKKNLSKFDYLKSTAEEKGEWIDELDDFKNSEDSNDEFGDYDSNDERNSRNTYPDQDNYLADEEEGEGDYYNSVDSEEEDN